MKKKVGHGRQKKTSYNITELHPSTKSWTVEQHITTKLLNIYPGEGTSENVNVTGSVKNGIQQMVEFQRNLPEVLHERLSSKDVTMPERKKTKMLKLNLETWNFILKL